MKIGIIGGSGLDDPNLLKESQIKDVTTEYGSPSSPLTCGKIQGVEVCYLVPVLQAVLIPVSKEAYLLAIIPEDWTDVPPSVVVTGQTGPNPATTLGTLPQVPGKEILLQGHGGDLFQAP